MLRGDFLVLDYQLLSQVSSVKSRCRAQKSDYQQKICAKSLCSTYLSACRRCWDGKDDNSNKERPAGPALLDLYVAECKQCIYSKVCGRIPVCKSCFQRMLRSGKCCGPRSEADMQSGEYHRMMPPHHCISTPQVPVFYFRDAMNLRRYQTLAPHKVAGSDNRLLGDDSVKRLADFREQEIHLP